MYDRNKIVNFVYIYKAYLIYLKHSFHGIETCMNVYIIPLFEYQLLNN